MLTSPVICASVGIGSEAKARGVADLLTESFDNNEVAVAAFEADDGSWSVNVHFSAAPDEDFVRAQVAHAAGADAATAMVFEAVEARDWVRASLDGLAPVAAGRFVVHGSHDRARVRANQTGIEIEAALAFGTGHHGTTRGCLTTARRRAAHDEAAKRARSRHRNRRAGDRRRQGGAPQHSCQRHRSPRGAGRARQCAAQRCRRA